MCDVGDVAGAQAKFVVFLASLLQRADLVKMDEFARLLAVFADSVAETDPGQARLLSDWAAVVNQGAQQ
jgi:hypothetical protein